MTKLPAKLAASIAGRSEAERDERARLAPYETMRALRAVGVRTTVEELEKKGARKLVKDHVAKMVRPPDAVGPAGEKRNRPE
jgi:hypothetical protein